MFTLCGTFAVNRNEQLTRLRRDTSGRNRIEVPRREVPREVGAPASGMEFARGALP